MNVCVACGRYFVCLGSARGPAPPVFFYFGNEDNVELYVEHTGLMWESAPDMGAALVFLEHRYYGKSLPFPPNTPGGNSPMSASNRWRAKQQSGSIEGVTYGSLARRPENARTWDKAHRNSKVAEVRDLSFCAGGRLTLARAHKDANSKDCADCADSVCENADSSARHPRWSARRQEASGRQEFGCHQ